MIASSFGVYIYMETLLTYNTKLVFSCQEDKAKVIEFLTLQRDIVNFISTKHFEKPSKLSLKEFHDLHYYNLKAAFPSAKSQLIIKAEQECLANYRSIKSNKHKIEKPVLKKNLSCRLDARLVLYRNGVFHLTTNESRVEAKPYMYDKFALLLQSYEFGDPLIFVRDNEIWISLTFKVIEKHVVQPKSCMGIDLGVRRIASTSEGEIIIDKKHNGLQRKVRHLKRKLRSSGSRSAKKHLKKLARKERNRNNNFRHHVANKLLKTKADCLVLEDLAVAKMKKKKNAYQNKSNISQIGFSELRRILTYKAALLGKVVVCVNPAYTSQTDSVTGKREGKRLGCRFYSKSGLVYDADVNAACNIARLSKLPFSQRNLLSGQAVVTRPNDGFVRQA